SRYLPVRNRGRVWWNAGRRKWNRVFRPLDHELAANRHRDRREHNRRTATDRLRIEADLLTRNQLFSGAENTPRPFLFACCLWGTWAVGSDLARKVSRTPQGLSRTFVGDLAIEQYQPAIHE